MASGVAHGVEIPNIEDMDIDPWADFEMISQSMGGASLTPASDDVYVISDDVGIMPLADVTNPSWGVRMTGFSAYGTDEDESDWEGVPIYDGLSFPVNTVPFSTDISLSYSLFAWCYGGERPSSVISNLPASKSSFWTGTPGLINDDPNITNLSTYSWNPGFIYYDVKGWEEGQASSFQIIDAKFLFNLGYLRWDDIDNINGMDCFYSSSISGGHLTEVHLIINGKDVGVVEADIVEKQYSTLRYFSVSIPDTKVNFEEQLVRTVSFRFDVSAATMNGSANHFSGGVGVGLFAPSVSGKNPYPLVSDSLRLFTGIDPSTENTGLLKGILNAITSLPGKIATAIIEGIKSLFIPDEDFLAQWKEEFFTMLKAKFGFIYECFEFLGDFFHDFILTWGDTEEYVFYFPGIEIPIHGETYVLVPEQDIPMQNGLVDIIRPFAGTVISIVVVLATISTLEDVFIAIISGYGYFQFIMSKREEAEDDIKEWEDELK